MTWLDLGSMPDIPLLTNGGALIPLVIAAAWLTWRLTTDIDIDQEDHER